MKINGRNMTVAQFVEYARKFCIALTAALVVLAAALVDTTVTSAEWVQIIAAFLGAGGVYQASNKGIYGNTN